MKALIGIIAAGIAIGGFINFFISLRQPTPIPVFISHPLAMIAMAFLLFQYIFPTVLYRSTKEERLRSIQALYSTGPLLASTICGGRIGNLMFRGPFLRVEVYPGGLLLKPFLLSNSAILLADIKTLHTRKIWLTDVVEILHTSHSVATPIQLGCSPESAVYQTLFNLLQAGTRSRIE